MIRAHVPRWADSVADYATASEATRQAHANRRTVVYGQDADEVLDLYLPETLGERGAPVHLFIHGGYWRANSKRDYAFLADSITAAGAVAAIMDYSLMPRARMEKLVAQVRQAAHWLRTHADTFGGDARQFSASGHSAGAHLASFLVCRGPHESDVALPGLRSVLLVSGIYDLEPITRSFLQPELQLTEKEVTRWSPVTAVPENQIMVDLLVGEQETAPFHTQAQAFADHLAHAGARSRLLTIPGEDHMTIIREVGRPGTAGAGHLAETIKASMVP